MCETGTAKNAEDLQSLASEVVRANQTKERLKWDSRTSGYGAQNRVQEPICYGLTRQKGSRTLFQNPTVFDLVCRNYF